MEKQSRQNWTDNEENALCAGIHKQGFGKWKDILSDPQFASLTNRSNTSLKDKWRNLTRQGNNYAKIPSQIEYSFQHTILKLVSVKHRVRLDSLYAQIQKLSPRSQNWTDKEEEALRAGVQKHGFGKWKDILSDPQFAFSLSNRSYTNLKDKWPSLTERRTPHDRSNTTEKVSNPRKCNLMNPSEKRSKKIVEELHLSKKRKVVEEVNKYENYHNSYIITRQRRGVRSNAVNHARKLNSEKVHSYLESLWLSFPEDKQTSFVYLDPLWYTLYSQDSHKQKVLSWIKSKDIFSRKYVFFPIVQWNHWFLLIFCHFGESLESKSKTPCILLLDSLLKTEHSKRLEPVIRKFVLDIYNNLNRTEDKSLVRKMPFLVPKVPQQRDNEECGFFVLYYIKLFVESAPESFSITDGYPYFMKEDWFSSEGLDSFCKTLDFSHVSAVVNEKDQVEQDEGTTEVRAQKEPRGSNRVRKLPDKFRE